MLKIISENLWNFMLFPMLISGVILSFRFGFFHLRGGKILSLAKSSFYDKTLRKSAFLTLAATMGTGNITGVAAAISLGGAGALFWMWVSSAFGTALAFAENFLAIKEGNAMKILSKSVKLKPLSYIFAVFCVLSSFGIGNMAQSGAGAEALSHTFGINPLVIASFTAVFCFLVIIGGMKSIGAFAEMAVPILSSLYIFATLLVIVKNFRAIPTVFMNIFSSAFGLREAMGGIAGVAVKSAVITGLSKGVFSNEAGMGSMGIIHSQSGDTNPFRQGATGVCEVFIDTVICCSLTAFAILSSGMDYIGENPTNLVISAFSSAFGKGSAVFVAISVYLFSVATIIGWEFIGETAFIFLFGESSKIYYKYIYIVFILIGATISLENVFYIADIFNALMAVPNIIGLLLPRGRRRAAAGKSFRSLFGK